MALSSERAAALARIALDSLHREYPNKIGHVLLGDSDARPPRELTPMFFGCFDWHSAVHSHWALVRLWRLRPETPWAVEVEDALAQSFVSERVNGELAFLQVEERSGFEMPYGMAWLLMLCAELAAGHDKLDHWRRTLEPLEKLAAERFERWLSRLPCPIRSGEHTSSAFAAGLVFDWALATGRSELEALIRRRALELYGADRGGPLGFEPSAYDFLSPCLAEADLLARLLEPPRFAAWLSDFLPKIDLAPVTPADRADGKLVHFDGLNLSRAWMLRRIAGALPPGDPRPARLRGQADDHERAGLEGVTADHYAGAHWLASFALYSLSCASSSPFSSPAS